MSAGRVAHVTTIDVTLRNLLLAQLVALRGEGFEVTGISAPGPFVRDLTAAGIRHIEWPHATRSWNPRADARAFFELVGIFKRERFDLVHTHNPKPGVLGRLAARAAGTPCIANTVHGLYATPDDRLRKRLPVLAAERAAARCSHIELYQSEEDLVWARRIGLVSTEQSALLGNGCDLTRLNPSNVDAARIEGLRSELGVAPGDVMVVSIGRLVAEKGFRELFSAAAQVRKESPRARFVIVGPADPDKADSLPAAELDAAREHVVLAGWREDIPDLLAAADIFVLPSWREGMPRSAIEAAAMELPLVLTDIRGCREVARDGIEGMIVPVRSPNALAEAINRLAGNPQLRTRMGAAARRRALELFDEQRVANEVVGHTRRLIEARGIKRVARQP